MTCRYEIEGVYYTLKELALKHDIPYKTLQSRLRADYPIEKALAIGRVHASSAASGYRSGLKALSVETERSLIEDRAKGLSHRELGIKYKVSRATAFRIVKAHESKKEQLCLNF